MERSLARLHATGLGGGMGRDQAHVVLYEDNSRRNVNALIAALRGLQVRLMQLAVGGKVRR